MSIVFTHRYRGVCWSQKARQKKDKKAMAKGKQQNGKRAKMAKSKTAMAKQLNGLKATGKWPNVVLIGPIGV